MSLLPPKVGDTVYIVRINNAARGRTPEQLNPFPAKVSSVGRKYFKVSDAEYPGQQIEFRLENWAQNAGGYSPDYQAYMSEQHILDELEAEDLRKSLTDTFNWRSVPNKLSLETLRKIRALIDAEKP